MTACVYSLILVAFEFVYYIQSADISELCSNKPFDAGMNFRETTFFFKGSNVWRMTDHNVDEIEGPLLISKIFPEMDVSSIDAAFQINVEKKNANDSESDPNSQQMQFLAFLFKDQNYYIFGVAGDNHTYFPHNTSIGVPFGLNHPKGSIKSFKNPGDERTLNAALFNRMRSQALFFVDTDVYVMSGFEKWTNSSPTLEKRKMLTEVGFDNETIVTAIDFEDNKVLLIFGQNYCIIKWTELKCNKKSIKSYFKCKDSTNNSSNSSDPLISGNATTSGLMDEQKEGLQNVVVIVVIGCAIFAVVLILSVLLFCYVFKRNKSSKTEKRDQMLSKAGGSTPTSLSTNKPSITHDSRSISGASDYSTFSGAFGPKK